MLLSFLQTWIALLEIMQRCLNWIRKIAMQRLNVVDDVKPIKQGQRMINPTIIEKINKELQKLKDVGFIIEEQHLEWMANIVSITKKNGQIRAYIDFRDLL